MTGATLQRKWCEWKLYFVTLAQDFDITMKRYSTAHLHIEGESYMYCYSYFKIQNVCWLILMFLIQRTDK